MQHAASTICIKYFGPTKPLTRVGQPATIVAQLENTGTAVALQARLVLPPGWR